MEDQQLIQEIKIILDEKKGNQIVTLDLQGQNAFVDYMIIVSAPSNRQLAAMADYVAQFLKKRGFKVIVEGDYSASDWVLLEAGNIMVHFFKPEARLYYNLEKMWGSLKSSQNSPTVSVL